MNLKEFLLMIFDKQIDRYPVIRESFLKCFDTTEIVDILAITNYRCSKNEFKRYIAYDCADKGIKILSLFNTPRFNPEHNPTDILLESHYTRSQVTNIIINEFQEWINDIHSTPSLVISIFTITTSNSEFMFSMTVSASARNYNGTMIIKPEVRSKIDDSIALSYIDSLIDELSVTIPLSNISTLAIQERIRHFCALINMPLKESKLLFNLQLDIDRVPYPDYDYI